MLYASLSGLLDVLIIDLLNSENRSSLVQHHVKELIINFSLYYFYHIRVPVHGTVRNYNVPSVADPDPQGSASFGRIRILGYKIGIL
jgi:hypothetical protein